MSFTLDAAAVGVGLVTLTSDTKLQVQYQVNGTVPPPSNSTVTAASATTSVFAGAMNSGVWCKDVGVLVVGGVLGLSALAGNW